MDLERSYQGLGDVIIEATDEIIEGKIDNDFNVDPIQGGWYINEYKYK